MHAPNKTANKAFNADSVKLSPFLQRHAKKAAIFTPPVNAALCDSISSSAKVRLIWYQFSLKVKRVPIISRFYGVIIAMYFNDHNPPHFHAKYSGYEALFSFEGYIIDGELPNRATKFVQEWIKLHKLELEDNWQRAQNGEPLNYIAPLE